MKKVFPDELKKFLGLLIFSFFVVSCSENKNHPSDTPTSGVIEIAVDESFAPIMDAEINVFEGLYKEASIIPRYVPETDAVKLLLDDSVRLIVVSRDLTDKEKEYFESKKFFPKTVNVGTDGIALIVNNNNPDSIFTTEMISGILTGKIKYWNEINPKRKKEEIKVVFDNANSGTVHYAIDSICGGKEFSSQVYALKTNKAVVEFVNNNPLSIGIIGGSWISDREDSTCMSFLRTIKVASITRDSIINVQNSFAPYQAYVALRQYPYVRNINIIVSEPRTGLASGFTSFIASDKGQRIMLKFGLVPVNQPLRIINVREEL